MKKAIIGKKVGMTQIFDADGKIIPITVIQAGPCVVVQKKTTETDGYEALQLGYEEIIERKLSKPEKGHLQKNGLPLKKVLREFRLEDTSGYNVGDQITPDVFAEGDRVDIVGTSRGKGFAGSIKRHGNARGRMSHGGGPVHRHAGSMGAATDPSRILPGKKMPGHMGAEQVTVLNLDVVKVDTELGIIAVRGAVPGPKGGIVTLRDTVKNA